jgi:hypothetical protein
MVNNLNREYGLLYSIRPSKNHEKSPIFTVWGGRISFDSGRKETFESQTGTL